MPKLWDFALVAVFAVLWPLYTHFIEWPRHVRRVAAGDPDARVALYRKTIVQQWAIMLAILAVTVLFARPVVATLGLHAPRGWGLALGIAVPAAYGVLVLRQAPAISKSARTRARLREKLAGLVALIPTRPLEWTWFQPLAVTAGICEEVMFRGYLVWVLVPWLGLYGAAGVSTLTFGLAHAYQGGKFGTRAFVAGAGMGGLALATGSILPGIVLHALIDLGSGYVTYVAMREPTSVGMAGAGET